MCRNEFIYTSEAKGRKKNLYEIDRETLDRKHLNAINTLFQTKCCVVDARYFMQFQNAFLSIFRFVFILEMCYRVNGVPAIARFGIRH